MTTQKFRPEQVYAVPAIQRSAMQTAVTRFTRYGLRLTTLNDIERFCCELLVSAQATTQAATTSAAAEAAATDA
ncbi:hypothetical protein LF1_03870 [Rubripirellula obstinata]|uniref:Uncharacterized protein n=1 Tax=Rubripirellula obstinata TaxID=406547 RepID=A0A5B1C9S7_9BACT|nr:hypothetical protein LF1_03870 [Rubripirellula obstinata]